MCAQSKECELVFCSLKLSGTDGAHDNLDAEYPKDSHLDIARKSFLRSLNSLIWHNKLEKPDVAFGRLIECTHVRLISRNHPFAGVAEGT